MANTREKRQLPKKQHWLIARSKALSLESDERGICYGLGGLGLVAILNDKVDDFDEGFFTIAAIPTNNFAKVVATNRITRPPENMLLAEAADGLHYIEFCHKPQRYPTKFAEPIRKKLLGQDIVQTLPRIIPDSLKAVGGAAYCGVVAIDIFNQQRLVFAFKKLAELINQSDQIQTPIAFFTTTFNHAFDIGYNKQKKLWYLIDANNLPSKRIQDTNILAKKIIKAAMSKDACIIKISAFCQGKDKIAVVNTLAQWKEILENDNRYQFRDINFKDSQGNTLLHLFCQDGYTEKVAQLIERGARLDIQNKYGRTALYTSISDRHYPTAETLVLSGANPNLGVNKNDKPGNLQNYQTAYHLAIKSKLLRLQMLMLERNANPNIKFENNDRPLHIAIRNRQWGIVDLLLQKKADVNVFNDNGESPLTLAVERSDLGLVKQLLKADGHPHSGLSTDKTPFFIAIKKGDFEIAREMLCNFDLQVLLQFYGPELLFNIIKTFNPNNENSKFIFSEFIRYIDINTPIQPQNTTLLCYAAKKNSDAIAFLVTHHADANAPNPDGETPLHIALNNNFECVDALLQQGANPNLPANIRDENSSSIQAVLPLEIALKNDVSASICILLQAGANPHPILNSSLAQSLIATAKKDVEIGAYFAYCELFYRQVPHEDNSTSPRFFAVMRLFERVNKILEQSKSIMAADSLSSSSSSSSSSDSDSDSDSSSDSDSDSDYNEKNEKLNAQAIKTMNEISNLLDDFIIFDKFATEVLKLANSYHETEEILAEVYASIKEETDLLYSCFNLLEVSDSKNFFAMPYLNSEMKWNNLNNKHKKN